MRDDHVAAILTRTMRMPVLGSVALPIPEADEIRVKVYSVGLNPTDFKLGSLSWSGRVVGCDWAGIVESRGSNATRFNVGDRVAGVMHGCKNKRTAAFSEYLCTRQTFATLIPKELTMDQAATLSVGVMTSYLVLRQFLGFNKDEEFNSGKGMLKDDEGPILVWSGATAFGMCAIQMAKILDPRRKIIATSSSSNFELLKSLGADYVFDYKDEHVTNKIVALGPVRCAIDTFSEGDSTERCGACLEGQQGKEALVVRSLPLLTIRTPKLPPNVRQTHIMAYTAWGEAFTIAFVMRYAVRPEDHTEVVQMFARMNAWLEDSKLRPLPVRKVAGTGLGGSVNEALRAIVDVGLPLLKSGKIRAGKLVATLEKE